MKSIISLKCTRNGELKNYFITSEEKQFSIQNRNVATPIQLFGVPWLFFFFSLCFILFFMFLLVLLPFYNFSPSGNDILVLIVTFNHDALVMDSLSFKNFDLCIAILVLTNIPTIPFFYYFKTHTKLFRKKENDVIIRKLNPKKTSSSTQTFLDKKIIFFTRKNG